MDRSAEVSLCRLDECLCYCFYIRIYFYLVECGVLFVIIFFSYFVQVFKISILLCGLIWVAISSNVICVVLNVIVFGRGLPGYRSFEVGM